MGAFFIKNINELGMVEHHLHFCALGWQRQVWIQGQTGRYNELLASQSYIVQPCLKKINQGVGEMTQMLREHLLLLQRIQISFSIPIYRFTTIWNSNFRGCNGPWAPGMYTHASTHKHLYMYICMYIISQTKLCKIRDWKGCFQYIQRCTRLAFSSCK